MFWLFCVFWFGGVRVFYVAVGGILVFLVGGGY